MVLIGSIYIESRSKMKLASSRQNTVVSWQPSRPFPGKRNYFFIVIRLGAKIKALHVFDSHWTFQNLTQPYIEVWFLDYLVRVIK